MMKDKVTKIINFRFDHYREIELKLEKLAAKGLFLIECGSFFWTFQKGTPQNLKYTVTYFSEGSIFNPDITNNQQTYFDYAKAAGWTFVTQLNQMQIFCSNADNPIPFETDEKEKFTNIKKCINKSFLPSMVALLLIFIFNLIIQFRSFQTNPIDFLSNSTNLFSVFTIFMVIVTTVYTLLDILLWYKKSSQSIANGGGCVEQNNMTHKIIDIIFLVVIFGSLGCFLFHLLSKINLAGLVLCIVQMPIMLMIFWLSIKYLKKKKVSATVNKIISFIVLIVVNFTYLALIMLCIVKFGFSANTQTEYSTVTWPISATASHQYRLYHHELPLTCQDLYGHIDYNYYSYKKEVDSTFFLTKSHYWQNSLPTKDAPPQIEYTILEPQFDFVDHLAQKQLLEIPEWRNDVRFQLINNEIFQTVTAYQEYYDDMPMAKYILIFQDKIITLSCEQPPTKEQIAIIIEKLGIEINPTIK